MALDPVRTAPLQAGLTGGDTGSASSLPAGQSNPPLQDAGSDRYVGTARPSLIAAPQAGATTRPKPAARVAQGTRTPASPPPSPPKGFWGKVGGFFVAVWEHLEDFIAQLVGHIEMLGIRFPVKKYEAELTVPGPSGQPVFTGVGRGSRRDAESMRALAARGYRSILSLCKEGDEDKRNAAAVGMRSKHISILDNSHPTMAQAKEALDFLTAAENRPAFVHCEAGVGRTGQIIACYRMAVDGWTLKQSLAEAAKYGTLLPNQRHFLEAFARELDSGHIAGYPLAAEPALAHPIQRTAS